jgi:hypothetical protein
MSGVIDNNGQQWEHCGVCGQFEKIQMLKYEPPSDRFEYGRDICQCCAALDTFYRAGLMESATSKVTSHKPGAIWGYFNEN